MNFEDEFLSSVNKWKEQITLEWSAFLETKILEMTFSQYPQVYDFFKNLTWIEGYHEVLEESEKFTISFSYPGFDDPIVIFFENDAYDFVMYLKINNQFSTFQSFLGVSGAEPMIWKTFWEFDLFSYIFNFPKIVDSYKT